MRVTYFLEVVSSWCFFAEPAWAELKRRFQNRAQFDWKIALMNIEECLKIARESCGLDVEELREAALSPAVRERVETSTRQFFAYQVNQRPAFLLTSEIGDKAVFSGIHGIAPLAAAIEAMLHDELAYASYAAHFGDPPPR